MEALQSGEYKQTGSVLYNPRECAYCCLGVAEKVINNKSTEVLGDVELPSALLGHVTFSGLLLEEVRTKCGNGLDKLNDARGFTFKQIANLLLGKKVRKKIN